ncbi:hypothetical protein B0A48_10545 [Cryoendolithus antarcticus]|uniref:Uncharacterized protein n=1 Tax=Cryoendolithus antarcticus TaxID=1507870 RepID=A0A1V8SXL6_9PEZI|nr:hypothetical protein B0A48_10545 [Cryoendolithus antarcticus]
MFRCLLSDLCLLLFVAAPVGVLAKTDSNNYFINPEQPGAIHDYGSNNVYVLGSVINLEWAINYTGLSLALWQNDNNSIQTLKDKVLAFTSLAWPVDLTGLFDLKDGEVFFFQIFDKSEGSTGKEFSSHYFNITDMGVAAASSAQSSASSTLTPTSSSSSSTMGLTSSIAATLLTSSAV